MASRWLLCLLLTAGCGTTQEQMLPHTSADELETPVWARPAQAPAAPSAVRTGTTVLGETQYEGQAGEQPSDARGPSQPPHPNHFPQAPVIYGWGASRGYTTTGQPQPARAGAGSVPRVGADWPKIQGVGPPMATTTPVHP
jgi:hypothetical protein